MKKKSMGFKIGVVLGVFHLCLVILAYCFYSSLRSSTAGLVFIYFFVSDAPILLLPQALFNVFGKAAPLIQFGVIGSAMWFLIPWLIGMACTRIIPKGKRLAQVVVIVITIPIILAGFSRLSRFAVKALMRSQRPAELKKVLNRASSDFLTEKVIFAEDGGGMVNSISQMNRKDGDGVAIIVGLSGYWCGSVFLDESYQEQSRLNFGGLGFNTIEPVNADSPDSCEFLAYSVARGVYLFDFEGKERWKLLNNENGRGYIDGVDFGDVDGDGKTEFAFYHRYGEGIHLVDGDGKTRWKHPVSSIGHLEIADIDGDGKEEIIYKKAHGNTGFTILDEAGSIVKQLKIATTSYDFATVKWPKMESKPYILIAENAKIRILDLEGNAVIELDAPGCRASGKVKVLTVKFKKDGPEYLAVRKRLHPDLVVLYVYDSEGKLVYQKTEVVGGGTSLALAVVPVHETGTEVLLVGSVRNRKPLVLEYSLTR